MRLDVEPYFSTERGSAYLGDAADLLRHVPDDSVQLIVTSPPYALQRPKEYDNVPPEEYVDWFMPFAREFHRVLHDAGSLVINIGGSWNRGLPTRSTYPYELILELTKLFHLAQDFYWHNTAQLPTPAEWVSVRRIRVKSAVEFLWWLSKTPYPKADNSRILKPYSKSMRRLIESGEYNDGPRPSGHRISRRFAVDNEGAIRPNFLLYPNTASNGEYMRQCRAAGVRPHPARFPDIIPDLFVRFLTDEDDVVLDPFAGSCLTGAVAEGLDRRWLCFDAVEDYLVGAAFRFNLNLVGGEPDAERPLPDPAGYPDRD